MPDIQPFRALRYNSEKVRIDDVLAPPYDVISPQEQQALLARSPYNIVRIELPQGADHHAHYDQAADLFKSWIAEGILERDMHEGFYLYDQEFTSHGPRATRHGFFALCRLEEWSKGNILPHEHTLSGPKEDRLKLLRAVQANISPIFALYRDPELHLRKRMRGFAGDVLAEATDDDGVRHVLRAAGGSTMVEDVRSMMSHTKVFIADGHHRYETALNYRNEQRALHPDASPDAPWNFILMYFAAMEDEGMVIQPTHRLLHGIADFTRSALETNLRRQFNVTTFASMHEGMDALLQTGNTGLLFAYPGTKECTLASVQSDLNLVEAFGKEVPPVLHQMSVAILHQLVLKNMLGISDAAQLRKENLDYVHTVAEVQSGLEGGNVQCAVLLNPTTMEQLRASAEAGVPLPQKSTYFYPKLITGLVMYSQSQ